MDIYALKRIQDWVMLLSAIDEVDSLLQHIDSNSTIESENEDGGAGSGNWGHAGRLGIVGGSMGKGYNGDNPKASGRSEEKGTGVGSMGGHSGKDYRLEKPGNQRNPYTGYVWAVRANKVFNDAKAAGKSDEDATKAAAAYMHVDPSAMSGKVAPKEPPKAEPQKEAPKAAEPKTAPKAEVAKAEPAKSEKTSSNDYSNKSLKEIGHSEDGFSKMSNDEFDAKVKADITDGLPDASTLTTNKAGAAYAKQIAENLGTDINGVSFGTKKVPHASGACELDVKQMYKDPSTVAYDALTICSSSDTTPEYREKTAYHENFHLMLNGQKSDMIVSPTSQRSWSNVEETLTECAANYMMQVAGNNHKLFPSYDSLLVQNLPRLKQLPEFKDCKTIQDFGRKALQDRLSGKSGMWQDLHSRMSGVKLAKDYYKPYHNYLMDSSNAMKIARQYAEAHPYWKGSEAILASNIVMAAHDASTGNKLYGSEKNLYSIVMAKAINDLGVM